MSSRRRQTHTRKTGPDSKPQATAPRNPPSAPSSTEGGSSRRISEPAAIDDNLHFKTGKRGKLARFFAKTRAARDPIDQTVILPPLIFLSLEALYDSGRVNVWGVLASLIIPASVAGLSIGACLGERGIFVAMLRGLLVGAIEGAVSVGILKQAFTQHEALQYTANLMYINLFIFWFSSLIGAFASSAVAISEQDWQKAAARRAFLKQRVIRPAGGWFYGLLIVTFSKENIARLLLKFFIGLAILLVLWIVYGIDPSTAIASFVRNWVGMK